MVSFSEEPFLAVDWGTTNRRIYVLDAAGALITTERDAIGVLSVSPGQFPTQVAEIRRRFGDLPLLIAGMVGSVRGWVDVPYQPCPSDLADLAVALHWVDERTAIVPGLSWAVGACGDVMRGEEVQLLGSVAAKLAPPDALLCQPGTHCKWVWMTGGKVGHFKTKMTGELFAMLGRDSMLAEFLVDDVQDNAAFREGVGTAQGGTLLEDLFRVRASILMRLRRREEAAAFVSGLLIGSDVREVALLPGETVYVLADNRLGALYSTALILAGARAVAVDSHAAFVAGAAIIRRHAVKRNK
ncbi:MAG: 2-dehydro-3-deoxygalactonokinase [Sphingomicrobium sp.]